MSVVAKVLIALVALEHINFVVLEMFSGEAAQGKAFGMSEQAAQTKVLAANQGLYNDFLAAGLIWSLVAPGGYAKALALSSSAACSSRVFTAARPRTSASGLDRRCPPRLRSRRCWCSDRARLTGSSGRWPRGGGAAR